MPIELMKIFNGKKEDLTKTKKGEINILMIGGRRAGKSSVLTSMSKCCLEQLAGNHELSVVRDANSGIALNVKQKELENYFSPVNRRKPYFPADGTPSPQNKANYGFDVMVNSKQLGYDLRFVDVKGEMLSDSQYSEELQGIMDACGIIIIAIDTPHLVEEINPATGYGMYHDEFNRVAELTRFFKTTFQKSQAPRLVMFVPLKCEKYYYRNDHPKLGMSMVNDMVKKGYKELFDYLNTPDVKALCTTAIVPILTLGGAEFPEFGEEIYCGYYTFVEDPALCKFSPKYCEQPLFLTLLYAITLTKRMKNKQSKVSRFLTELIKNEADLTRLMTCEKTLKSKLITDAKLGFEILNDPLNMTH